MALSLFRSRARRKAAETVYLAIAEASRAPGLYLDLGVPDTVEGRFESLSLHVCILLRRLKQLPPPALDLSKDLIDHFFADLDSALRELGVGDLSVGKKIKALAEAFYGRAKALDDALLPDRPLEVLTHVLEKNVLAGDGAKVDGQELAAYVENAVARLDERNLSSILSADQLFPPASR
jgi:cytochrome b pre-mRNA-processing protein 3